ncbi:MAG: type II toxin-antitoxin system RelE/ParE family toxin [Planctomycetes bacterium]|nr:type II toxin-antitoxin system RelE/ParE family toxin [Planctomycetota bacterium]
MKPVQEILLFPKAVRDLEKLDQKYTRQVLEDVELLRNDPWPAGKIKKRRGTPLWEIKTGDYRSLFLLEPKRAVIARGVNRKTLEAAVKSFDIRYVLDWLRRQEGKA